MLPSGGRDVGDPYFSAVILVSTGVSPGSLLYGKGLDSSTRATVYDSFMTVRDLV